MSTLKADTVISQSTNGDLTISGNGTGVPDIEAGFKVGGTAGLPINNLRVGTDGELITWDASGDPAAVAVGTATHILTSNGAGAAPTFQAAAGGGAWTLIGTDDVSDAASATVTGLDTTVYDTFAIVIAGAIAETDGMDLGLRLGDSGGIDSGSTDYAHKLTKSNSSDSNYAGTNETGANHITVSNGQGAAATESFSGVYYLTGVASMLPLVWGTGAMIAEGAETEQALLAGSRKAVITVDRVQLLMNSGNITVRLTVFGIKHT